MSREEHEVLDSWDGICLNCYLKNRDTMGACTATQRQDVYRSCCLLTLRKPVAVWTLEQGPHNLRPFLQDTLVDLLARHAGPTGWMIPWYRDPERYQHIQRGRRADKPLSPCFCLYVEDSTNRDPSREKFGIEESGIKHWPVLGATSLSPSNSNSASIQNGFHKQSL